MDYILYDLSVECKKNVNLIFLDFDNVYFILGVLLHY